MEKEKPIIEVGSNRKNKQLSPEEIYAKNAINREGLQKDIYGSEPTINEEDEIERVRAVLASSKEDISKNPEIHNAIGFVQEIINESKLSNLDPLRVRNKIRLDDNSEEFTKDGDNWAAYYDTNDNEIHIDENRVMERYSEFKESLEKSHPRGAKDYSMAYLVQLILHEYLHSISRIDWKEKDGVKGIRSGFEEIEFYENHGLGRYRDFNELVTDYLTMSLIRNSKQKDRFDVHFPTGYGYSPINDEFMARLEEVVGRKELLKYYLQNDTEGLRDAVNNPDPQFGLDQNEKRFDKLVKIIEKISTPKLPIHNIMEYRAKKALRLLTK